MEANMVIYLDQYRVAKPAPAEWLKNGTYGDEVMQANWNPAVVELKREATGTAPSPELPDDHADFDVDAFLGRVYALATLI
jgi:hypothetical protein